MERIVADLVVEEAAQLLTCAAGAPDRVGLVESGWVALAGERVVAAGSRREVEAAADLSRARRLDARGKVVAPGFVDAHTHLVFGGSRVEEYVARLVTDDPEELRRRGVPTGIGVTIRATRTASEEDLFRQAAERLEGMLLCGTTTVESKSGYGLDTETELKQLRVNRLLERAYPVEVVSTFLGAHGWPQDTPKERYLDLLEREMLPAVRDQGIAEFCDVWCDEGHYDAAESRRILEAGLAAGLAPKIHTGAYSHVGGASVAADLRAASADHLNYTPRESLEALARSGVTGVLLPGIDFSVRHPRPFDPRPMEEAGLELALATNCCPGCWCTSMPFLLTLACRNHRLSPAEALRAATLGGARALLRGDRIGSLEPGKRGDLQIWNLSRYEDLVYRLGAQPVETVVQRGRVSVERGRLVAGTNRNV